MYFIKVLMIFYSVVNQIDGEELPAEFRQATNHEDDNAQTNGTSLHELFSAAFAKYGATSDAENIARILQTMESSLSQLFNVTLGEEDHKNMNMTKDTITPIFNCFFAVAKLAINVKETYIRSPLVRMIDASGKLPSGVLNGNGVWIGDYNECLKIPDSHHCLNSIKINGQPLITHGTCAPTQCSAEAVGAIFKLLTDPLSEKIRYVSVTAELEGCSVTEVEYSTEAIVSICVLSVILLCCVLGTAIDVAIGDQVSDDTVKSSTASTTASTVIDSVETVRTKETAMDDVITNQNASEEAGISMEDSSLDHDKGKESSDKGKESLDKRSQSIAPIIANNNNSEKKKKQRKRTDNKLLRIITSFSLLRNTRAIFSTRVPPGAITSINGIRFISMTWVILGHYYVFGKVWSRPDNIIQMFGIFNRFTFLPVANAYFSVDTFFLLSGLLVSYLTLRKISKGMRLGWKQILLMYVHRYIRLTPTLVIIILFFTNVFPYTFTGPFSTNARKGLLTGNTCYKYWWTNLLYINNFYPYSMGAECVGWTWYLANDMQFYTLLAEILHF